MANGQALTYFLISFKLILDYPKVLYRVILRNRWSANCRKFLATEYGRVLATKRDRVFI